MANVIRPAFGHRPKPDVPAELIEDYRPLRVYGSAVGHIVGLIRADVSAEDRPISTIGTAEGQGTCLDGSGRTLDRSPCQSPATVR